MSNFIVKNNERKQRQEQILKDFGQNSNTASKEAKEKAEYIAEKTMEIKRNWRV
ncbi:hypothetical protein Amet_2555 [Alkaliphilus metalliredigens QYMF]|uniref:Uncharacterized protein n=1 Tax=Alkaliphilus metalliredigens (strain QYMF) TaxID=293826 RepID=A6TR89_ALKMQ|nr:hypothetical protein [Alkaliphilus metalliredigens]ABR48707.1 hypothetical protein Amet_2555 [Alkaliphilus metalliredigens QYMF]